MNFVKFIIGAAALLLHPLAANAKPATNILDLTTQITDTAIVFPESYQTDVHRMQQNWYLQNFTVLDTVVTSPVSATDKVITERLAALPTTIEMPFNQVVRSHIDLYVNRRRSLVETMLGMSLYYMPLFEQALEREGVPLELRYLPIIESALNPDAVSRAGATGLWQFMLATARGLGLEVNTLVDERRDPIRSSEMAAKYLRQLYDIYHDWGLAIAAYNCGPGNVNKALLRAGASEQNPKDYWDIYYFLPQETRGYVPGFIAANYAMTYYADHGISPALAKRPIVTDTVHVHSRIELKHISDALNLPIEELKMLNPQYRKGVIPGDLKPYPLTLPSQLVYAYLLSEDSIAAKALASPMRRSVVEIGGATTGSVEQVKWHKVRKGETLGKIAQKYGVSVENLKKWNNLKSSKVARGKSLKIITYTAPVPAPVTEQMTTESPLIAPTDTVTTVTEVEVTEPVVEPVAEQAAPQAKPKQAASAPKAAVTTTHKVRKGETLWKIAQQYGTTVAKLQQLNGLNAKSKIQVGQRIKIPQK